MYKCYNYAERASCHYHTPVRIFLRISVFVYYFAQGFFRKVLVIFINFTVFTEIKKNIFEGFII